jgi:hypothetical protein
LDPVWSNSWPEVSLVIVIAIAAFCSVEPVVPRVAVLAPVSPGDYFDVRFDAEAGPTFEESIEVLIQALRDSPVRESLTPAIISR